MAKYTEQFGEWLKSQKDKEVINDTRNYRKTNEC